MMLDRSATLAKTDNFVATTMEDEIVLLNVEDGQFYRLEGTARRAWELADIHSDVGALVDALCSEYEVDETTCRTDVGTLMSEMESRKFIEIG